ncbi:glycosyltransferase family 4 protein [Mesobacillus sp. AQ2]|uniref:glycosyltransferase family 4 protein n=1 Tax=Mesobacillus sp. AQ2 TaxID=3043332 RepID=UPI0024C1E4D3|nr:glycosyltransferase family 4 protein [Mesobacillus sp. AQ2]WHX40383.1 glycosyltransferase family 4 protein [Mesobacillus sp. AQ2]
MKNICFIFKITKNYGGAERRFARLINYLSKDTNYKINVILVGKKNDLKKFISEYLVNSNLFIFETSRNIKVLTLLLKINIDIVHFITVNSSFFFLYRTFRFFKKKKEIILSLNSYDLCLGKYKNRLQKITFHELLSSVDKIDCLYPLYVDNVKRISQEISSKEIKIHSPNNSFTDLEKFKPSNKKSKVIVFASRLIGQKNPILAIQAVNECRAIIRSNDYKVIFAGGGPLYSYIEEYIKTNKLEDIVNLTGNIDLSNVLATSRIFLSIQDLENYPSQSLLEAVSSGNFVIASEVGDTKRIVKEPFGMLTSLNLIDLTNSLIKAIKITSDNNRMDEISKESRAFAMGNFKISLYADHIKGIWSNKNK